MPLIKPYLIVPTLVEQPTWGGDYIATLKNLSYQQLSSLKIGQSYELFRDSHLSQKKTTMDQPSIDLAPANDPSNPKSITTKDTLFSISELIIENPLETLGKRAIDQHGESIEILLKLNQAKGNSYQVHASKRYKDWLPKPETWFFLEPGTITLGLNTNTDWKEYKKVCSLIEKEALLISKAIFQDILSTDAGRERLQTFVSKHNPRNYVNTLEIAKNKVVDLSAGGIHHSWEDNKQQPNGNVIYEIQKNVYDPDCTLRSFDKGKIKDDGSTRPIHIDDYFAVLNKTESDNLPEKYSKKIKVLKKSSTYTVHKICKTLHYTSWQITLNQKIANKWTTTDGAYHHLFVRRGHIKLKWNNQVWIVSSGFSIFIPAMCKQYQLSPYKSTSAQVIITSV